jgi:hypothetical protein
LDDILDVSISDIKNVIIKTKEYMVNYGEYLEKEKDGGIKMIENEQLRGLIKSKIRAFIKGKMDKARGLKMLKHEFNLPNAELSDLWLECKNEICVKSTDKIPGNEDIKYSISEEEKTTDQKVEPLKTEKKISLKVIRVTTEVQGEYGTYVKNNDGVKIGDNLYSDLDAVKKEKIMMMNEFNTKMDNIKDRIRVLNDELKSIQDLGMKEIEKFTEIESVFGI